MSARIKRNAPLLRALCNAPPRKRKDILRHSSDDFIHTLCELSLNLLKGNVPLSTCQYKKLKRQKNIIRALACKKTSLKRKRGTLMKQSGGFILPLLSAVVPLFGQLLGGLIKR